MKSIQDIYQKLVDTVVATSAVDLAIADKDGNRQVRSQETNLGDLCADAYRIVLGADIAFVNGGGIRVAIEKGDITYGEIINVHPFGNMACVVEATGQQILDALEMGARNVGIGENGGFLQVSYPLFHSVIIKLLYYCIIIDKLNSFFNFKVFLQISKVLGADHLFDFVS